MIETKVYSLSRTEMARIASEEYIRSFWWLLAPVPICGAAAVIFANGPLQILGFLAVLWPFSIPARSVLSTTKSSRLFSGGCHVEATDEEITFIGEYVNGKRLRYAISLDRIKEVVTRRDILLIRLRIPGIAPIRADAFCTDEDRTAFVQLIEDAVERRLSDPESDSPLAFSPEKGEGPGPNT